MVRIAFMGDTHVDITRPAHIVRTRKKEFRNIFVRAIDAAIAQKVDLVCHLGDLFDRKRPAPIEVQFVIEQLLRLGKASIKFYVIRGNHEGAADLDDLFEGWAGEYVKIPDLDSVELISPRFDEMRHIATKGFRDFSEKVRVYGVGHYRRKVLDVIKQYIPLNTLDSSKYNIFLFHGFVESINETKFTPKSEEIIPLDELTALNFDLVALGHSHESVQPQKKLHTTFLAPGSPVDWYFGQEGSHGFFVVDIDETARASEFHWIPIETDTVMKNIFINGKETPHPNSWFEQLLNKELEALLTASDKKLILRVRFKGVYAKGSLRFQSDALRKMIQEKLGDRLLHLGTISLKELQYETKKHVDITQIQEIKMDEDEILYILKEDVDVELATEILELFTETDEKFSKSENLTPTGKDLKKPVREALQDKIEQTIRAYFQTKFPKDGVKLTISKMESTGSDSTPKVAAQAKKKKPKTVGKGIEQFFK